MHYQTQGNLDFLLFPSRNFMVLCFIFRSIIHWVNFFEECKICIYIYFCIWIPSYSSTIWWKDYPFSIELPLLPCQKSVHYIRVSLFLESIFCTIYQCGFFFPPSNTKLLDYSKSWSWVVSVLQLSSYPSSVLC